MSSGLCPDWETWDPRQPVENAREAMQQADDWLGVPQVAHTCQEAFRVSRRSRGPDQRLGRVRWVMRPKEVLEVSPAAGYGRTLRRGVAGVMDQPGLMAPLGPVSWPRSARSHGPARPRSGSALVTPSPPWLLLGPTGPRHGSSGSLSTSWLH